MKTESGNKVFIVIFLKKSFSDQPVTGTIPSYISIFGNQATKTINTT
jgi:hypothetical protein